MDNIRKKKAPEDQRSKAETFCKGRGRDVAPYILLVHYKALLVALKISELSPQRLFFCGTIPLCSIVVIVVPPGGFPIKIETQISKAIAYTLAIFIL